MQYRLFISPRNFSQMAYYSTPSIVINGKSAQLYKKFAHNFGVRLGPEISNLQYNKH